MFFNNSESRNHAALYGADAFYDLKPDHPYEKLTSRLRPGDSCVVAKYEDKSKTRVRFSSYRFAQQTLDPDEHGVSTIVFRGSLMGTDSMLKAEAAAHPRYSPMFNVLGHFKRPSVIASV